jgi:hypothetical protein
VRESWINSVGPVSMIVVGLVGVLMGMLVTDLGEGNTVSGIVGTSSAESLTIIANVFDVEGWLESPVGRSSVESLTIVVNVFVDVDVSLPESSPSSSSSVPSPMELSSSPGS